MVRQLNVFMENKLGRLHEICDLLGKNGINIRGFSVADMAEFGLLRLIVDKTDEAKKVLRDADFPVSESEILIVSVPDRPGGLASVLKTLSEAGLSVEYTYIVANTKVAFSVNDLKKAEDVLIKSGFEILEEGKL